jgi:L-iditol 2-dehydrogenase
MSVVTQTIKAEPSFLLSQQPFDAQSTHVREINESFVLSPARQFTFEERPIPELRTPRDVRVRVIATGLCGSDVSRIIHPEHHTLT